MRVVAESTAPGPFERAEVPGRAAGFSAIVLMAAVLAGACEAPDRPEPATREEATLDEPTSDDPTPEEPTTAVDAMAETAECVNEMDGYAIRYPAGWEVNPGDVLSPCSLFDPESIQVPPASEIPLEIAVMVGVEPVPFETLSGGVLGRRDLSRQATMVEGRSAVRIEAETTGEGLHDTGIRFYQVLVDLDGRTFVAATYGVGSLSLDAKRAIVDRMMATLRLREPQ